MDDVYCPLLRFSWQCLNLSPYLSTLLLTESYIIDPDMVSIVIHLDTDSPHSGFTGLPASVAPAACLGVTSGTTDNDLVNGVCKNLTLIFARGTTESGNIGGIVGPPFVNALVSMLGKGQVAVQGVNNYPADVQDFLAGGSVTGSQDMAALIAQAMTQCPQTKLCVSGYSQGAQVAHNAANLITPAQTNFINSVVLFGDPDDGEAFGKVCPSKVSTDCHLFGTYSSEPILTIGNEIESHGMFREQGLFSTPENL